MTFHKIILVLLSSIFISCNYNNTFNNTEVIIQGNVKNNVAPLKIENLEGDVIHTFDVSENNTFIDTINISEGYYLLTHIDQQSEFYLRPSYNLNITLDARDINKTIEWKGIGSVENKYITSKKLLEDKLINLSYYGYYTTLNESDFLKLNDSIFNLKKELFSIYKDSLDKRFSSIESSSLKYHKLDKIASYPWMKRMFDDNDFEVSSNYPNPFQNIDLNNEDILVSYRYFLYVVQYLDFKRTSRIEKDSTLDSFLTTLNIINDDIKNQDVKNELLYNMMKYRLIRTSETDKAYELYLSMSTNEDHHKEIRKHYESITGLSKGLKSPDFELENINGELVSLSKFQGKVVYIDLWATWCKPCLKEFPHLENLKKDFKNKKIVFLSICKSSNKENWKNMVKSNKLSGVQLFASNDDIDFFKEYSVNSLPRFILLDENAKLISKNAERPSNPELKNILKKLL